MKRILPAILCLTIFWELCGAQDPQKTAGPYYVYDSSALPALTPAPRGYKPFYISHFARHGARSCTSEYDTMHDWLAKAAAQNVLTEEGKAFAARYNDFYKKVQYRNGNLTKVGQNQHRMIAEHMYRRFPAVFKGQTHVEAVSTESPRVIMSMWSCLSRLQALDKSMDVNAESSARFASWLQPSLKSNPYYIKGIFSRGPEADKQYKDYFKATVPCEAITTRYLTTADACKDVLGATQIDFISIIYAVAISTRCLDEDQGCFDDLLSQDELNKIWRARSARTFMETAYYEGSGNKTPDYAAFTLNQIIESADADIAAGDTRLRLRFGHDSGVLALLAFMNVNGFGRTATTPEEAVAIMPNYEVPMASSVQLVFYRKPGKDILFKVLLNEREASLPSIAPVEGPYYRWEDFKAYYLPRARATVGEIQSIVNSK